MDKRLRRQLAHKDAKQRTLAIRAVLQRRDQGAIPHLRQLAETDPNPQVRRRAAKAVAQLERCHGVKPAPDRSSDVSTANAVPDIADLQADAPNQAKGWVSIKPRFRHLIYTVVLLVTLSTVFIVLRQSADAAPVSFGEPTNMPPIPSVYQGQRLDGNFYRQQHSSQTTYFILEPKGKRPAAGWPIMLGVHGSGDNGMHIINQFGHRARREGVILVAPTFAPISPGSREYSASQITREVGEIMSYLDGVYGGFHPDARVMFGFSMGCTATYGVTIRRPALFRAGGLFGCQAIDEAEGMPPPDTTIRYTVITGSLDERVEAAQQFVARMDQRGTPVFYADIEVGVDHTVSRHMVNRLFVMVNRLR